MGADGGADHGGEGEDGGVAADAFVFEEFSDAKVEEEEKGGVAGFVVDAEEE